MRVWYDEHLGVGSVSHGLRETGVGPNVLAPFSDDTDDFAADRRWMINFRVTDLDRMCKALAAAGIGLITREEWNTPGVGRFARIHDPEGNPIELWEPDSDP